MENKKLLQNFLRHIFQYGVPLKWAPPRYGEVILNLWGQKLQNTSSSKKNSYTGGNSQPQSTCQPHFAEKWLKVDSGKKGSKGWLVARNFRLVSSHGPKKSTFLGLNRAKGWLLPQKSGWSVYMALKSQPFWGSTGLKVDSRRKNQGGQFTWPQKVNLFEAQQG